MKKQIQTSFNFYFKSFGYSIISEKNSEVKHNLITKPSKKFEFPLTLITDKNGYLDRQCPKCENIFKIDAEDWENKIYKIPNSQMYCPRCKCVAPLVFWNTKKQFKKIKKQIENSLSNYFNKNLDDYIKGIKNNINEVVNTPIQSLLFENTFIGSTNELYSNYTCKECGTKYSVIGSAFFCPCCGNISITDIFEETLKNIEKRLKFLPNIKSLLIQLMDKDFAENTNRDMTENCLKDVVSAFQMLASEIYVKLNGKLDGKNDFQNISKGSELLKKQCRYGYENWLNEDELKELNIFFQKRHLIVHTNGIINEKYITKSGDATYKVSQRLVIKEQDVLRLISIVKKLGEGLMSLVKR